MTDLSTPQNPLPLLELPSLPPIWGRMETLWLWMAPLCALLFALAMPLAPNDLWYHVRAGQLLFENGAIPTQNLMSSAVPLAKPYYYQSWLAEWLLFAALKFGGLSALMVLRAACVGAAVLLVVATTFRQLLRASQDTKQSMPRLQAARWTALLSLVGFAMASNNLDLRPQTFSMLFFGAWIFAACELRAANPSQTRFWAIFIVVLTAIWANTHGAFVISILGLSALTLGDALSRQPRTKMMLAITLASVLAVSLNPRGFGLYIYVAQLSNNEIGQRFIQEWKSPGLDDWHSVLFWLSAMILAFGGVVSLKFSRFSGDRLKMGAGELFVLALFFVMAARDQRAIIWFALWIAPATAPFLSGIFQAKNTVWPVLTPVPRAAQFCNAVLLLVLLMAPLTLLPRLKPNWPWPPEFRQRFAPTSASIFPGDPPLLLEKTTAVAAAQFLRAHPPRGALFTDMVCGSFLTYATAPRVRPLCDPRIELFSVPFWENYLRLSAGSQSAVAELEKAGFSDALLDKITMPRLVKRFRASSKWRVVAQNGTTILFRRLEFQPKS